MSTEDQSPLSDIDRLRTLILGEDEIALRTIGSLTQRVGGVEDLLSQDPVTVDKMQALLSDVLHGLEGDERRLVQDRLMALLLVNIQNEIKAAKPSFVQAIYPVAGGLVRKGIQQAIGELLELIEERLAEPANIYKRTQIRFQSLVTGKPEAEIWLRQTGLFHVDRVLMVDRASGTVITGLRQERDGVVTDTVDTADTVQGQDQIVSGMLTAIMSFSQEAFGDGGGGELSTLEFENSQLHIKATPLVLMVVRTIGTPPAKIDSIIDNRFDRMVTDNAEALGSFDGSLEDGARLEIQAQLRRLLRELRRAQSDGGNPVTTTARGRPLMTFLMALGGVILASLLIIATLNAMRINGNVNRVQNTLDSFAGLEAYPIDAHYDRSQASVVIQGLVPDAGAAGLLETTLRNRHSRLSLDFDLSNIATDAVRPNLRGPRIEREANSSGVNQLRDEAFIRDTIILDLEQQVADLNAALLGRDAIAAALSYPSLTYDLDPALGELRDRLGAELIGSLNAGSPRSEIDDLFGLAGGGSTAVGARPDDQTIAASLIGFTEAGAFTDIALARHVAKSLVELMATKPESAVLEVLTVARPQGLRRAPESMGHFIGSKTKAILLAHGLPIERIRVRTGAQAASVEEIDPGSWRKSHFVGFRLAY